MNCLMLSFNTLLLVMFSSSVFRVKICGTLLGGIFRLTLRLPADPGLAKASSVWEIIRSLWITQTYSPRVRKKNCKKK